MLLGEIFVEPWLLPVVELPELEHAFSIEEIIWGGK